MRTTTTTMKMKMGDSDDRHVTIESTHRRRRRRGHRVNDDDGGGATRMRMHRDEVGETAMTRAVARLFTDEDDEEEEDNGRRRVYGDRGVGSEGSSAGEGEYDDDGPRAGDVVAFFAPPSAGTALVRRRTGELRAYSARGVHGEVVRGNARPVIRDSKDVPVFLPSPSPPLKDRDDEDEDARLGVEDASTQLEVLRFGKYYGFRSHAAGGKLLQARRRLDSRLCFFNFNFGVCEQWALVGVEHAARFGRVLTFRNRRLQAVTMHVIVKNVSRNLLPMYATEKVDNYEDELEHIERATSTPRRQRTMRRLAPPPGDSPPVAPSTSSMYDVMSTHLISEWSEKLSAEVQVRRSVENELGALRDDLQRVYEGTMIEVQSMQTTLNDFKAKSAVHMNAQGKASVRAVQEKAVQRISKSSARMQRNFSFRHWKAYAQRARMERMSVVRFMIRKDSRQINLVFAAWKRMAQYLASIRRKDVYARARNRTRRLNRCFLIWRKATSRYKTACRIAERAHKLGVAEKERELKLKIFCTWRLLTKTNFHVTAFRERVVGRIRNQLVVKAFHSWRRNARVQRVHELAVNRFFSKTDRRIVHKYFHTWINTVHNTKVLTRRLLRVFKIWDNRTAYAALNTWREMVRECRSQKTRLISIISRMRNVKVRSAWDKWVQATAQARHVVFTDTSVRHILGRLTVRRLFVKWKMLSQAEHEEDKKRIISHRFTVLNRAFIRWKVVLRMKEDMKRMITTKRVTNNLFLDWHWSVYGEEFTRLFAKAGIEIRDDLSGSTSEYHSPEEHSPSKLLWSPPKPRRILK